MSSSKLKLLARSRMERELITSTPLPSAAHAPSWNWALSKMRVHSEKVRRTEDTEEQPSGELGGSNSEVANPHLCRGLLWPPAACSPQRKLEKEAAGQSRGDSSSWAAALPSCPGGHPPVSVALGGAGEGCQGIHLSVHVLSIFCALYAKEALLQPHFLLKTYTPPLPVPFYKPWELFYSTWDPVTGATCLSPSFFFSSSVFLPSTVLALC